MAKGLIMTKVITASKARANIYNLIDTTAEEHTPVLITGKRNNAVIISEDDFNAIQETLYLMSIPNMRKSIIEGMNVPIDECTEDIEW